MLKGLTVVVMSIFLLGACDEVDKIKEKIEDHLKGTNIEVGPPPGDNLDKDTG